MLPAKLVDGPRYHLWSDALHARALAREAENDWDRGAYVRWTITTAWTVLEKCCSDALQDKDIGYSFKKNLDNALNKRGLPSLSWGSGLWQRVATLQEVRKDIVHRDPPPHVLFIPAAEGDKAISIVREAVKFIFQHAGQPSPSWIDDDQDRGWAGPKGGFQFGITTVRVTSPNSDGPGSFRVAVVFKGEERTVLELGPNEDPQAHVERLISNANAEAPISGIKVYRDGILIEERALPFRGS